MMSEDTGFRDSSKLTLWVRYLLYAQVVVAAVSIVSNEMEHRLLTDFQIGRYATEAAAIAAGEASDSRQTLVAMLYMLVFLVSAVLILMWIYRANYNARQLGANEMTFTPGWSVGWYFVPIAALWKPYQAMKEIWRASHRPDDWQDAPASALLPIWWCFYLISSFVGQALFRWSLHAEEIDELMALNRAYVASDALDIVSALVMLALVNRIYAAQMAHVLAGSQQAVAADR